MFYYVFLKRKNIESECYDFVVVEWVESVFVFVVVNINGIRIFYMLYIFE